MDTINIRVTEDDLRNYEKYEGVVTDYPLYGHTSNVGRADIVFLAKWLKYDFGNDTVLDVTIKPVKKIKIEYK